MLATTTAGEGKEEEAVSSGSGYSTSTSSFLNNIWSNALSVGFDTYEGQKLNAGKNNDKHHVRGYAMAAASHKAATDILKTAQKLSVKEKLLGERVLGILQPNAGFPVVTSLIQGALLEEIGML